MNFWKEHPALFYGLAILIGAIFAFYPHPAYLPPAILLLASNSWKKGAIALAWMGGVFVYAYSLYLFPAQEKTSVEGRFSITNLSLQSSPFHRSYLFEGILKTKQGNIPCRLYFPLKKPRPFANHDLWVQGILLQKGDKVYVIKPISWKYLEHTFSFAEKRFELKEKLKKHLQEVIPDRKASSFLLSMLTGEIEERLLSYQFNRLGLQHILGVSGFQFVLLAATLRLFLRLFLPLRAATVFLLVFLSGYFFVLGDSPPVFRAFVSIAVSLVARLWNKRTTPLNALGVGLVLQILWNPLVIAHLGFQLSYICTAAILILFPWMKKVMEKALPLRPLTEASQMTLWNQHGYIASSLIRESLALNFAVHIWAVPLLLFHFHKFSMMSLVYNLFFPFGGAIVFLILLLSLALSLVLPPLGGALHLLNSKLTAGLLFLTSYPPVILDYCIRIKTIPLIGIVLWISGLFFFKNQIVPGGGRSKEGT